MPQKKASHLIQRSLLGIVLGMIYAMASLKELIDLGLGALSGMSIGLLTAWLDHYIFTGKLIRKRQFVVALIIRTLAYILGICVPFLIISFIYLSIKGESVQELYRQVLEGRLFWGVLYSFMIILFVQYINLTTRLLGPRTLANYLMGKYYTPKEEERIFMFLDIKSSTTIAESLGHFEWHRMLNDFFFDITEPIYRSEGAIYQYVGDEVVISWSKKGGLRNVNCLRCFYRILRKIATRQDQYMKRYGYELAFKAGLHIGKVVTGEIGDVKREIVFHGDTVNTASRIQEECNRLDRQILISEDLLGALELDNYFEAEYMGSILLRGKGREMKLYSPIPLNNGVYY